MVEWTLRDTLAAHPEAGVALWAPRRLRDMPGLQLAMSKCGPDGEPEDAEAAQFLDQVASFMAGELAKERDKGTKRLILSEENFLGGMRRNLFAGTFYRDVVRRLSALDRVLPQHPVHVAMGLRNYGSVWTSAYHYTAQQGKKLPTVAQAKGELLTKKRGWPDVMEDVRRVWHDTGLIVWQQESLADNLPWIGSAIVGLPPDAVVVPDGKINARKKDGGRPDLFDADETRHLTHRYNRHLRRMRADPSLQWAKREEA